MEQPDSNSGSESSPRVHRSTGRRTGKGQGKGKGKGKSQIDVPVRVHQGDIAKETLLSHEHWFLIDGKVR